MHSAQSAGYIGGVYYSGAQTGRISSSSQDKDLRVDDSMYAQKNNMQAVNITNVSDLYMKQPRTDSSQKLNTSVTAADTNQKLTNNSTIVPSQF